MPDSPIDKEAGGAVHDENYSLRATSSTPRRRGCAAHCGKFWWAYLLAVIVVVAIVVPVVLLVAVKNKIQHTLDSATLTVEAINVRNTKADSVEFSIDSTIAVNTAFEATVEGFQGVMYLEDEPSHKVFATLDFPETNSAPVQKVNVTKLLQIDDMEAFTTYNKWLLANETLRVTVEGDTHVRVKGIARRYPAHFRKVVTMNGLRSFAGIKVLSGNLTDPLAGKLSGFVNIPNFSNCTIEIGNATLDTFLNGTNIGTSQLENVVLYPGASNNISMNSEVDATAIITAINDPPYCSNGGIMTFSLTGRSVENNGEVLPYFTDALASSQQSIDIPIGQLLKDAGLGLALQEC